MRKRELLIAAGFLLLTAIGLLLAFWPQGLSRAEKAAVLELSGYPFSAFQDISKEALDGREDKFPAARLVLAAGGVYAFICRPEGYYAAIDLVVVIDSSSQIITGVRIVRHRESREYVRDFESGWFAEPFAGKNTANYFRLARLGATWPEEIDIITGATITSQAVLNGVNTALGVYREYVLGLGSEAIPERVDGYIRL
ncbi:MAG: FMN-binding protein [Clostridiales bacterium]|nr:FMN-binding protein [Clostridiales bacterium]